MKVSYLALMRHRAACVGLGLVATLTSACANGSTAATHEHWVGTVTTLDVFCVGRHAGVGECFQAAPSLVGGYSVGDCVEVTADKTAGQARLRLTSVKPASAREHRQDCP
jgi:hypothetical protein